MTKLTTCKTCEKEVAKSAKSCPHCGAKLKSGWFAKIVLVFFVFILLVIFIGEGGSGGRIKGEKPAEDAYKNVVLFDYKKAMLNQYPKGEMLAFTGEVNQIVLEKNALFATKKLSFGSYAGDSVYLMFEEKPQLIDDEKACINGRYIGTKKYETVLGAEKEVPVIQVDYYNQVKSGDGYEMIVGNCPSSQITP